MEHHVTHPMLMDMDKNLHEKQWGWRWQAWPPWHFAQRFVPQRILGTEQHPVQSSITFVRQSHCLSGCFGDFLVSTKDVSFLSVGNFNVHLPLCIKEEKLAAEKIYYFLLVQNICPAFTEEHAQVPGNAVTSQLSDKRSSSISDRSNNYVTTLDRYPGGRKDR